MPVKIFDLTAFFIVKNLKVWSIPILIFLFRFDYPRHALYPPYPYRKKTENLS